MKNITIPQALVLLACIAAPIVAYKFLGSPEAAAASMVVGMVLNFLLGRGGSDDPPPPKGPDMKVLSGLSVLALTAAVTASACSSALPNLDDPELQDIAAKLAKCRADARAAAQIGASPEEAYAAYEACKHREGLQ